MPSISPQRLSAADRKYVAKEILRLQKAIKAARKGAGLTQEKMAEDLGISVEFLRRVENGKGNPSLIMMVLMARYLGMRVELT